MRVLNLAFLMLLAKNVKFSNLKILNCQLRSEIWVKNVISYISMELLLFLFLFTCLLTFLFVQSSVLLVSFCLGAVLE